jgi:hypothetical protein
VRSGDGEIVISYDPAADGCTPEPPVVPVEPPVVIQPTFTG